MTKQSIIRTLAWVATLAPMVFSTAAYAQQASSKQSSSYFGLKGEVISPSDSDLSARIGATNVRGNVEYSTGGGAGVMFGHYFTNALRGELELTYRAVDIDKITTTVGSVSGSNNDLGFNTVNTMVNGYYDIDLGSALVPYVGVGVGMAYKTNGEKEAALAYQGMIGASYALDNAKSFFGGYRYIDSTKFEDNLDIEFGGHVIEFGVRWTL